ncbi:MAG: glycosyltransferase family 4 protein [Panacagrimonas sp.]
MSPLRILLTNNTLRVRAGSELVVLDLAIHLRKLGHFPVAYSSDCGPIAEELKKNCVPAVDRLGDVGFVPDVIHGQHHLDAMTAMARFPNTPSIYVCHGWTPWQETPPAFPNIQRYVAVSELTEEKLRTAAGISSEDIRRISNGVDLARFRRRTIPTSLQTAVIFSNYVKGGDEYCELIARSCKRAGIGVVDIIGAKAGTAVMRPEDELSRYDLVFAIGRSALEAMAVGCAVIVASPDGLAGLVLRDNVAKLGAQNFGLASLDKEQLAEETLVAELRKFDPSDSGGVCEYVRDEHSLERVARRYVDVYREAISRWEESDRIGEAFRQRQWSSMSSYLAEVSVHLKAAQKVKVQLSKSSAQLARSRREVSSAMQEMVAMKSRFENSTQSK